MYLSFKKYKKSLFGKQEECIEINSKKVPLERADGSSFEWGSHGKDSQLVLNVLSHSFTLIELPMFS